MKKKVMRTPDPSQVTDQVTDAVTQSNVKVVADAPAIAMGSLYQTSSHSLGLLFENTVNAQGQSLILAQTVTAQGSIQIYGVDSLVQAFNGLDTNSNGNLGEIFGDRKI